MDGLDGLEGQESAASSEMALLVVAAPDGLGWTVVQLHVGAPIVLKEGLIAAYQAASSPHSIRAMRSDLEAFDAWCRRTNRIALPATPEVLANYLDARAGKGCAPASLCRYKASIAKNHQLLDLKGPDVGGAGEATASRSPAREGHSAEAGAATPVQRAGP